jgi:Uma2 family endonuclease
MNPVLVPTPAGAPDAPETPRPYVKPKVMDLPPELVPNIDHLVFEDEQPADSLFAERQQRLFVEPLYASWAGPPESGKFAAMANVGLFREVRQTPLVPDGLLSAGVGVPRDPHPREHHSYLLWVYGQPPSLVLELVSDRSGGELGHKQRDYARVGVAYYVVYDRGRLLGAEVLHAFETPGGKYVPLEAPWFPELALGLTLWPGVYEGVEATWVRWCDRDGNLVPTGEERARQAEAEADQAGERARQAEERARQATEEAERQRLANERLFAQLRALGGNPEP